MSEQSPKDSLPEFLKKLWLPVAGFLGAVTLAYNFYKLWLGDQATVNYFLAGAGLLLLIGALAWVGFKVNTVTREAVWPIGAKKFDKTPAFSSRWQRIARIGLEIILLGMIAGGLLYYKHKQELQDKLIVLITTFEGPEDVYGLHNEVIESLNTEFSKTPSIQILAIRDVVTPDQGSPTARDLGKRYMADIVIWGWYRPTQDPNVTIHVENLSPQISTSFIAQSSILHPPIALTDLESFSFQQQLGGQAIALVNFLAGLIQNDAHNFVAALACFDKSLKFSENSSTSSLVNLDSVYLARGNSYYYLSRVDQAIVDYSEAININPQNILAYVNRGYLYYVSAQYDQAIADSTKAIQLNPQDETAYYVRGLVYDGLKQYNQSISDYTQAIKLDPQFQECYVERGDAYSNLGQYSQAISDYTRAIQLDPQDIAAYENRGDAYFILEQYDQAIADYTQAIKLNPLNLGTYVNRGDNYKWLLEHNQAISTPLPVDIMLDSYLAATYLNRGIAYTYLQQHNKAITDFTCAILLNPQLAEAYYNRSLAYIALDHTAEAEADMQKYHKLTGQ